MTIKNRCDTIAKILYRRLDLNEYKDSSSHFGLSKALLKQDAAEVISAYKNVFDYKNCKGTGRYPVYCF